jgi:hypothetical protein
MEPCSWCHAGDRAVGGHSDPAHLQRSPDGMLVDENLFPEEVILFGFSQGH